jgi:hypothetical protein
VNSAIFWTWLRGPIGLIIATPLTLCLVVLGRHFDQLSFVEVLLGSRPALRPSESLYQRLLASDLDEAEEQLEEFAQEHSLAEYYDNVGVEALQLASADFRTGTLTPVRASNLRSAFEDLAELAYEKDELTVVPDKDLAPATAPRSAQVLCLPGRGPFDSLATLMLAQLFRKSGIEASTSLHEAASRKKVGSLELKDIAAVCVLYLEISGTPAHIRLLIRRLKQRNPGTKVILGLLQQDALEMREELSRLGADEYVPSLQAALESAKALLAPTSEGKDDERETPLQAASPAVA